MGKIAPFNPADAKTLASLLLLSRTLPHQLTTIRTEDIRFNDPHLVRELLFCEGYSNLKNTGLYLHKNYNSRIFEKVFD